MVIPVMGKQIKHHDGKRAFYISSIARQRLSDFQYINVVKRRQSVIGINQSTQGMHVDTSIPDPIKTFNAEPGLIIVTLKQSCLRHVLNVPVNTDIGLGLFNYTIYFNDSQGNIGTPDLVWITIEDTGAPTSNSPANATYEANSTGNTIGWVLQDTVGPGYYQVLRNGTVAVNWTTWLNNTDLAVAIDTDIGLGLFNYTI